MRIQLFTKRPLQVKFLFLIVSSMLVPLAFVVACLYYLIFTLLADQLGIPESIAMNLFPVINKINLIIVIGLPPILILLLLWGMYITHKFFGPLERLEREINRIAMCADCTKRLRLRKDDAIKPFADAINRLLENIEKKR